MLKEGAEILDIGGSSTPPDSEKRSSSAELGRANGSVATTLANFPEAVISIDTFYASVAKEAVAAGASIVNDISGGALDENMISTVASLQVPYVLVHLQGTPQTMQQAPRYENVTKEVLDFFIQK